MLLLSQLHCSHFIICMPITPSHTLLLNHHKHCCYFITYYFAYTAIKSSQTLLSLHHISLHHIHCSHFITCPAIASSHTLLLLHHIHYSYFIAGYVSTSSHALLLLQHMHCPHFITGTAISPYALLSLFHMHCVASGDRTHDY